MRVEALHRPRQRAARAAHEPLLAGPLLAARLREERLRRARQRRRRRRAAGDPAGPMRLVGRRPRRQRDREASQGLRRSRGRHLSPSTRRMRTSTCRRRSCGHGARRSPVSVTFAQPTGRRWRVATQLHAGASPLEFTAPNLQHLMDSPSEFGPVVIRQFTVGPRTFRFGAPQRLGRRAPTPT